MFKGRHETLLGSELLFKDDPGESYFLNSTVERKKPCDCYAKIQRSGARKSLSHKESLLSNVSGLTT